MDYHLSEDEFNGLESSADQIDLLTSLCAFIPKGQHAITITGLGSFLCAQQEVLRTTLKALAERQEAQRKSEHNAMATERCNRAPLAISLDLLLRIMDACSGAVQDDEAIIQIHSDLYDATVMRGQAMCQIVSFVISVLEERALAARLTRADCVSIGDCELTLDEARDRVEGLRALPVF